VTNLQTEKLLTWRFFAAREMGDVDPELWDRIRIIS
jgi:hypothetical protein